MPQYIVDQSHPAIIDPVQWQKVQDEMAVRKSRGKHHNSLSPFSAKIVCGDCGDSTAARYGTARINTAG